MFTFIENLRQKPVRQKQWIAFSAALFFAGSIFVLWLLVVFPRFRGDTSEKSISAENQAGPWTAFKNAIGVGVSGIAERISSVKDAVSTASSEIQSTLQEGPEENVQIKTDSNASTTPFSGYSNSGLMLGN